MAATEKRATELSTKAERLKAAVGESKQRCKNHKLVADSARSELKDLREASGVPYSTICALKAFLCSIRSELPSYASRVKSQKFCGISLSSTFGTKGDPPVELSPSSSFDLTNSF
ncbi:hypothetical protein BHM03_00035790 [Ensete ventricosum]|nr:hypothetical protein BHM03_00035790 [Ensete ventricosum]